MLAVGAPYEFGQGSCTTAVSGMSTTYIGAELRRQVAARANHSCEYCLIRADDTYFGCHIDHVIIEKHGGSNELDHLAYSCTFCNLHKGSEIGSLWPENVLTPFFNPRTDTWTKHFILYGFAIEPPTIIGEVTVRIL